MNWGTLCSTWDPGGVYFTSARTEGLFLSSFVFPRLGWFVRRGRRTCLETLCWLRPAVLILDHGIGPRGVSNYCRDHDHLPACACTRWRWSWVACSLGRPLARIPEDTEPRGGLRSKQCDNDLIYRLRPPTRPDRATNWCIGCTSL